MSQFPPKWFSSGVPLVLSCLITPGSIVRLWPTVGTLKLAFLSLSPLPGLIPFQYSGNLRSSWERPGRHNTTAPEWGKGAVERKRAMRALEMERGGESQIKRDKRKCRAPQTREGYFIAKGTTEKKLRGPGMQKKRWLSVWTKDEGDRGGEHTGEKRFRRGGGEIRGFAGAAWTTSDLNGALNPAVAYPDFSSISSNTFNLAINQVHTAPLFPQQGVEIWDADKTVKVLIQSCIDSASAALSILVE